MNGTKYGDWTILDDPYDLQGNLRCDCGDTVHFTECYQLVACPSCGSVYHIQVGVKIRKEEK